MDDIHYGGSPEKSSPIPMPSWRCYNTSIVTVRKSISSLINKAASERSGVVVGTPFCAECSEQYLISFALPQANNINEEINEIMRGGH